MIRKLILFAFAILLLLILSNSYSFGQGANWKNKGADTIMTTGNVLINGIMRLPYYGSSDTLDVLGVDVAGRITIRHMSTGGGVAGTTDRITASGGIIDISAAYVGQTSINTLGAIATGTWQATKVGLAYGGTNADLSATGGSGQVLRQSTVGGAISVGTLSASDLSNGISGAGGVVLQVSPALTTPHLGTPSEIVLTNATGLPIGGISATGFPSSSTYLRGDGTWSAASVGVTGISSAMTAGAVTVSTTAVSAGSKIFLTPIGAGSGSISLGTITAGTSFVINSSNGADTRTVQWWIIN